MPSKLFLSLAFSAAIAFLAYQRGSLARSGAAAATLVGTLTFGFGGLVWGILLSVFFVTSSLLSHFKEEEKREAAEKFEKGHSRDFGQVMANGGLGGVLATFSAFVPSAAWFPLFVGVMATVTADTWATEIGTLAKRRPRLITSGRPVEVGTSGAISPLGTAVSAAGGLAIGLTAAVLVPDLNVATALIIGLAGGLAGSLLRHLPERDGAPHPQGQPPDPAAARLVLAKQRPGEPHLLGRGRPHRLEPGLSSLGRLLGKRITDNWKLPIHN